MGINIGHELKVKGGGALEIPGGEAVDEVIQGYRDEIDVLKDRELLVEAETRAFLGINWAEGDPEKVNRAMDSIADAVRNKENAQRPPRDEARVGGADESKADEGLPVKPKRKKRSVKP